MPPAKSKKLAAKLPELVPQPHGGAILTGGVPGHVGAGGRPPDAFYDHCEKYSTDPELWEEARKKNPNHVLEMAARFTRPEPPKHHKIEATVRFEATRE